MSDMTQVYVVVQTSTADGFTGVSGVYLSRETAITKTIELIMEDDFNEIEDADDIEETRWSLYDGCYDYDISLAEIEE